MATDGATATDDSAGSPHGTPGDGLGAHRALLAVLLADPDAMRREFELHRSVPGRDDHEAAWAAARGAQRRLRRGSDVEARREVRELVALVGDLAGEPWWTDPALAAQAVAECIAGAANPEQLALGGLSSAAAQQSWHDAAEVSRELGDAGGRPGLLASLRSRRAEARARRLESSWRAAWADWARAAR